MLRQTFNMNRDDDSFFFYTMLEKRKTHTDSFPIWTDHTDKCVYVFKTYTQFKRISNEPESSFIERVYSCMLFLCMHKRVKVHQIHICILLLPFLCNMHTVICLNGLWVFQLFSINFGNFWTSFSFTIFFIFKCLIPSNSNWIIYESIHWTTDDALTTDSPNENFFNRI